MSSSINRFLVMFGLVLLAATTAWAQDLGAVRARMAERLPKVDALKAAGAVGEDNRGYLAVREAQGEATSIVSAENADRRVVYEAISRQTGSTVEAVGKARARQIAAQSAPGVWLQSDDGNWHRK